MKAQAGQKVMDGAAPFLEDGEEALAGIVAAARGNTTAKASGGFIAREIGHSKAGKQRDAAAQAGIVVASPMGVVVTNRRLLTLKISAPLPLGKGGDVKELLSAVPLAAVERIEVKRLLVGKTLKLEVGGSEFKLEAGAGADANGLVQAFEQARGAVI
jgi:hypothetical protein